MEVLIRVVDKGVAEDSSRRGDIISICPDGWGWSQAELTNPDWRIVRVPILQVQAEALLATPLLPNVKRRREWTLDFSLLPDPALFSGDRTQPIISLTRKQVADASSRKP